MEPIKIEIPSELFSPAETLHLEDLTKVEGLTCGMGELIFDDPVKWSIDITNTGSALLVSGTLLGRAKTSCSRCLEDAYLDIDGDIEGYFIYGDADVEDDDLEEDEFDRLSEDDSFDLAPLIQSAILLEIPPAPLCKDDCKGICPVCGMNLNDGDCSCSSGEDEIDSSNPFSMLKDFFN